LTKGDPLYTLSEIASRIEGIGRSLATCYKVITGGGIFMKYILIFIVLILSLFSCAVDPIKGSSTSTTGSSVVTGSYVENWQSIFNSLSNGSEIVYAVNSNACAVKIQYTVYGDGIFLQYKDSDGNWQKLNDGVANYANPMVYYDNVIIPVYSGSITLKLSASASLSINMRGYYKGYTELDYTDYSFNMYNPGDAMEITVAGTIAKVWVRNNNTASAMTFYYKLNGVWVPVVYLPGLGNYETEIVYAPIENGKVTFKTSKSSVGWAWYRVIPLQ
jgi:hypothetical protein